MIPLLSLSRRGSLVELSTSKQSSQLARVRVTPGTRFINIYVLLTLRPERDLDDILQGVNLDDFYILALVIDYIPRN